MCSKQTSKESCCFDKASALINVDYICWDADFLSTHSYHQEAQILRKGSIGSSCTCGSYENIKRIASNSQGHHSHHLCHTRFHNPDPFHSLHRRSPDIQIINILRPVLGLISMWQQALLIGGENPKPSWSHTKTVCTFG